MDLLVAWVAFPATLMALATGCGLLLARLAGGALPRVLLPAAGFSLIVVVAGFLTLADTTAELATPMLVALALAGWLLGRDRLRRPNRWAALMAVAVFAVYAAPIVLSGEATFAGYIRLDDTATWLALTDRVMEHGRDLDGLAPSTYEATLAFNLADGYPIGVFLPLGVVAEILGEDVAWLIQPYMAFLAALLALALWALARPLVGPITRAAIAFIGAQSALLFGYYLWGGVKEVAAAMLVASLAACVAASAAAGFGARALVAVAVLAAALTGVLSAGGLLWIVPALALAGVLAARVLPPRAVAWRVAVVGGLVAVLSLPVLLTGGLLPPTSSPLTDGGARGNLIGPVEPAQVAGVWPAGDFRLDPVAEPAAYLLIATMAAAAAAGLLLAVRARAWGVVAYVGGTLVACLAIWLFGSPWVDGKALATAAPAVPFAAGLGLALLAARGLAVEAAVVGVVLAAGVIWSNALAYRDVNLAPREQLAELEWIGERVAGQGPALLTEYQPYGARHFLREVDPEAASELRRRPVALSGGGTVPKGEAVDTDALDPGGLLVYRTLVLRRSPARSRPPAPYTLTSRGDYYEVWQRPVQIPDAIERIGLGGGVRAGGRPRCDRVDELAALAGATDRLIAAPRPATLVAPLSRASYPRDWSTPATRARPAPEGEGTISVPVSVRRRGPYEIWLRGSVRPGVRLEIDGAAAGEVRHQLNNLGQYVLLGESLLGAGSHTVAVRFGGADLHPGSGGAAGAVGPLVLYPAGAADADLVEVAAPEAHRLCGRAWDWIELDAADG